MERTICVCVNNQSKQENKKMGREDIDPAITFGTF